MCLIVVKKDNNGHFTVNNFESSQRRNSDGIGIMFVEKGRVVVERLMGTAVEQLKLFKRHMHKPRWVLHLRYATHGTKNVDNCHPYKVLSKDDGDPIDLYMAHNGTLRGYTESDKTMSDTWNFVENQLKPILKKDHTLLWNIGFQHLIDKAIENDKLVFLDSDNNILTFNSSRGETVDGCWLSNTYSINKSSDAWFNKRYDDNYNTKYVNDKFYHYKGKDGRGAWYYEGEFYETIAKLEAAKVKHENFCNAEKETVEEETKESEVISKASEESTENSKSRIENGVLVAVPNSLKLTKQVEEEEEEADEEERAATELSLVVNAIYDPAHRDHTQLDTLIEYSAKNFTFADVELLVDYEPEIACDLLYNLLQFFTPQQSTQEKAA